MNDEQLFHMYTVSLLSDTTSCSNISNYKSGNNWSAGAGTMGSKEQQEETKIW